MPSLEEIIIEKRPNLSASSVKTYKSILSSLHRAVYPETKEIKVADFENSKDIIKHLTDELTWINNNSTEITNDIATLDNILQELQGSYMKALYKLKNLS